MPASTRQGNKSSDSDQAQASQVQESLQDRLAKIEADAPDNGEWEARLRKLEAELAEERTARESLQAENITLKQKHDDSGGQPLNLKTKISKGNGYRFRVSQVGTNPKLPLEPKVITACDEGEAIRYYCCTTQHPKKANVQINPSDFQLKADCLDEERRKSVILHDRRVSRLRSQLDKGHTLTEEELEVVQQFEDSRV